MYSVFSVLKRKEIQRSLREHPLYTSRRQSSIKTMWDATRQHPQTEWVLCSDDWQDIVITYIPQMDNTPIEHKNADMSLKEIEDAYFKHSGLKRSCQK